MKFRALTVAALSALAFLSPVTSADIIRESTGQRRADLDRMELARFPEDAWTKLTAWANGEAPTATTMDGKVVLVMSWASWHPASLKSLPQVQGLAAKYGPKGLLVIGVHNKQGWDNAAASAKTKGLSFPVAHDSMGDFRKALKIDHDPEFYFIDRAGHLRYASVSSSSLEEACAELVGETKEQANDIPRIRREREEKDAANGRRTSDINKTIDLSTIPAVPPGYFAPSSSAYKGIDWPKVDTELGKKWGLVDDKDKMKELKIAFQPLGYFPSKPETQGRAIVIYLWHPDVNETYSKVMPQMDLLQQSHQRDLAVIGAAIPIRSIKRDTQTTPGSEETVEKMRAKYLSFISSRNFKHALAADFNGSSLSTLLGGGSGGEVFPIPGAIVVSSDGIIRWVGWTDRSDFKYAIETIIAVDPAVKARRAADRAFIEKTEQAK